MSLIPAAILKLLEADQKKSHQERIIDYLVSDGRSVSLTDHERYLLKRWQKADDLLSCGRYTSKEVANMLVKTFAVDGQSYSISTAWRDLEDTRYVFGNTKKVNKKYRFNAHLERLEAMLVHWQNKDAKLAAKIADSYTYALSLIKDEDREAQAPPVIILNFNTEDLIPDSFAPADAQEAAEEALKNRGIGTDYLDFEDIEE